MPSRVPKMRAPASDDAAARLDDARRRLAEFVRQLDPKQASTADAPARSDRPMMPARTAGELTRRAAHADARATAGRSSPRDAQDRHVGLLDDVAAGLAAVVRHGSGAAGDAAPGAFATEVSGLTYAATRTPGDGLADGEADRAAATVTVRAEARMIVEPDAARAAPGSAVTHSAASMGLSPDRPPPNVAAVDDAVMAAAAPPFFAVASPDSRPAAPAVASNEHPSDAAGGLPVSAAVAALGLPPRLAQTLSGLLAGRSEKQVARDLEISPHTVHTYVKQLHKRLGVASRGELLARFIHAV